MTTWRWCSWRDLTVDDAHALFALRQDVFIVEQECAYNDIDGIDPSCEHLLAFDSEAPVACLRLVPPGLRYDDAWSIGRVVTARCARGRGLARDALQRALARLEELAPGQPVRLAAQCYLEGFYASLGFVRCSDDFDEDGIPHVDMQR